jgi:hypothetical protein
MPLAGWLFRVPLYTGGRLVNGCDWLTPVRLEGRPLNNPPRITWPRKHSCMGRPLRLPSVIGIELVYETSVYGMVAMPSRRNAHTKKQPGGTIPPGCFFKSN